MFRFSILFFSLVLLPYIVFAQTADVVVSNKTNEDMIFDINAGSKQNTAFILRNNTDLEKKVIIKVDGDESLSLVKNTKFFTKELNEKYKEQLENNDNNVILFCQKLGDEDEIKEWCEGVNDVELLLPPNEDIEVLAVIDIDQGEVDHSAQLTVTDVDDNVLENAILSYKLPDKNITKITLKKFGIVKENSIIEIQKWLQNGLNDKYSARFNISNDGTEDVEYEYCVQVKSVWINEDVNFCDNDIIKYGEDQEKNINITVPRFGKVSIMGSVKYADSDNDTYNETSEPIEMFIWPMQIFSIIIILICVCFICVLIYKYISKNKNMFGRKKKKKENKYTGSYVVNSTDNIISIAQSYGVPWKELAEVNEIEPPYILIPGESIMVPESDEAQIDTDKEETNVQDDVTKNINPEIAKANVATDPQMTQQYQQAQQTATSLNKSQQVQPQVNNFAQQVSASTGVNAQQVNAQQINTQQAGTQTPSQQMPQADLNSEQVQKTQEPAKPRKITYASPDKMLTKPSAEPTTAIDIDWMQDDEKVYSAEMEKQKKEINVRFIIITIIIMIGVGLLSWWAVSWYMNTQQEESVSVEELIEEDVTVESENNSDEQQGTNDQNNVENDEQNQEDNQNGEGDGDTNNKSGNEQQQEEGSATLEPKDLTIQVLNGGAPAGVAGSVTKEFASKDYKTNDATNASNEYNGVTIYYTADKKAGLEDVMKVLGDKYGTPKQEESDSVTKKYNADFVIVVGA